MMTITSLTKTYGSCTALADVTLSVPDGAVTAVVGPAGSGRSTLLGILAQLVVADSGRVLVDGEDFARSRRPGSVIGTAGAGDQLPEHLRIDSHLAHVCALQGLGRGRVNDLLAEVGLHQARNRRIKDASLAVRRRVGLAVALSGDPRHVLLDEPLQGLGSEDREWTRRIIRRTARAGSAVVLTAPRLRDVATLADHVVTLDRGRVVRAGPLQSFVAGGEERTYVESEHLEDVAAVLRERGYFVVHEDEGILVHGAAPHEVGRIAFDHGPGLSHLRSWHPAFDAALDSGLDPGLDSGPDSDRDSALNARHAS
ncbi:ATP-binding cassette domain-containing protein [Nocardioides gilvus]|uniref:ATP-binding cassette domain-containing protein n=1 Tax=Nocardioides gilvus TaxID=1735589 RepID=UPI000D744F0D|nr:ABC transporter ATP-binding protein [Nocardioides gilvus]